MMRLLGGSSSPVREAAPLAEVDDALRVASRREFFTPDEAVELLERVAARVPQGPAAVKVADVVAKAVAAYADHVMFDRSRLVDPLLDIRLALEA